MATPKRLDFSSLDLEDFPPSSPSSLPRPKSQRDPSASDTVAVEEETKKKKKKTEKKKKKKLASSSGSRNRIWNEEDEIAVLKGLVDYRVKTGFNPKIDWDDVYRFVRGSIVAKVSKEQVWSKIKKLRKKFDAHLEKINQGNDPLFTRSTDSESFGLSMMIWGKNDDDDDDEDMDNANQVENVEETVMEGEEAANAEPLTENGTERIDFDGESPPFRDIVVDKITDYVTAGRESHVDNGTDADELCAVRDAFETLLSQGLRDYEKKLQLENLMNLGTGKRKELSNEWKALCDEEMKLIGKKLRFSAKLAEAAI